MSARISTICIAALALGACNDATLPWQLDHDRIIAVRASPPHIAADGRSSLDMLITTELDGPSVVVPQTAAVVPEQFEMGAALPVMAIPEDGGWTVVAPDADTLAAVREARGWPADMPLPVRIAVTVEIADKQLAAIKTVYLGSDRDNPTLGSVTLDGQPARDGLIVSVGADVPMTVTAQESDEIDWLTSFGELRDPADTLATLRTDEPVSGQVAVVIRDSEGGVVWGSWSISAE